MKPAGLPLIVILVISLVGLPFTYVSYTVWGKTGGEEFYFGVSYGGNTTVGAETLVNKVKDYTNLFVIDSFEISNNEAQLNEVCSYTAAANLNFIVYFFSVFNSTWQQNWATQAKQQWGDQFLGVYLRDEPGGRQIDLNETVPEASSYAQAAQLFVDRISGRAFELSSMQELKNQGIPVYTSDYALYYYDYLAGYDTVFVELGWNNSRAQQIALCRGAARELGRDWGAIVTWTYLQPPYIESGPQMLQDMVTAYHAGAKYVVVFDYPTYPEGNPYGILTDEHFAAMQQFWKYIQSFPKGTPKVTPQAVMVLPKDFGGGLRKANDTVWGLWQADAQSRLVYTNLNKLSARYGLGLDVAFDGDNLNLVKEYNSVYLWNQTLT